MKQQIIFIEDTRKSRVYAFATKDEERKFRLFWMMGLITEIKN